MKKAEYGAQECVHPLQHLSLLLLSSGTSAIPLCTCTTSKYVGHLGDKNVNLSSDQNSNFTLEATEISLE